MQKLQTSFSDKLKIGATKLTGKGETKVSWAVSGCTAAPETLLHAADEYVHSS